MNKTKKKKTNCFGLNWDAKHQWDQTKKLYKKKEKKILPTIYISCVGMAMGKPASTERVRPV